MYTMQESSFDIMVEVEAHREILVRDSVGGYNLASPGSFFRHVYLGAAVRLGALLVRWGTSLQRISRPLGEGAIDA
jgi:hypothetical protein